jgi:hypothetical protein
VKLLLSRIAITAVLIIGAGVGWFGLSGYREANLTATERPTDGSIKDGVYTNHFFQFTVQFPSSWKVLSAGSGPQVNAKETSYVLLLVGSPDSQMHGTRWIMIAAAHPPASSPPSSSTAEDIVRREADALKAGIALAPELGRKFRPLGEPFQTSIAGTHLVRLDLAGQVNVGNKDYDVVSSQLAIIERGYFVLFNFTDPKGQESDSEGARKAMDSLHFLGNKN